MESAGTRRRIGTKQPRKPEGIKEKLGRRKVVGKEGAVGDELVGWRGE